MKIREIASGLQFPEGPVAMHDGSVVLVEIARGTLSRVLPDGTRARRRRPRRRPERRRASGPTARSTSATTAASAGAPRSTAPSPDRPGRRLFRRPHRARRPGHRQLRAPVRHGRRPGACAARTTSSSTPHGGFYFTDLGKVRATEIDRGGVFYGAADGSAVNVIARPVLTPNGIALSPDGRRSTTPRPKARALWAFDITGPGQVRKRDLALAARRPHASRLARAATTSASTRWPSTRSATSASRP